MHWTCSFLKDLAKVLQCKIGLLLSDAIDTREIYDFVSKSLPLKVVKEQSPQKLWKQVQSVTCFCSLCGLDSVM